MPDLVWTIPIWPLLGWLVLGVAGGRLPRAVVGMVASGSVALSFAAAVVAAVTFGGVPHQRAFFTWIAAGGFTAQAALLIDALSIVMALVVTGVGFLIHVYSIGYMSGEPALSRYFAYLNLFMGSMLLLVMGANLLVLFVGWELVGLCSYLLIAFWFDRERAANAGRKAFIVNRIGDAAFLLGIVLLWRQLDTLDLGAIAVHAEAMPSLVASAAALLLFIGATGKSAQLPLYTWLPDAMEGPTPVSALIHAATMVTAGVYMVGRLLPLFSEPVVLTVIAAVGGVTALFAATIALVEWDLKRVLAYSTISQLGYMFLAMGVLAPAAGIFHLTTHAFFKALLFLAAGSVMHAMQNVIDMRALGGLARPLRYTAYAFFVGTLALAGVPPLAGFFSKDRILEAAWIAATHGNPWPVLLGLVTALATAVYITRAALYTFFGPVPEDAHPHEAPPVMLWPMATLAALTVFGGALGLKFLGEPLVHFLGPVFGGVETPEDPLGSAAIVVSLLSIAAAFGGLAIGGALYKDRREPNLGWFRRAAARHWFLADLYDGLIVPAARRAAYILAGPVDLGVIDRAVNAAGGAAAWAARGLRVLQTGYVRQYAAIVLVGTVLTMIYWIVR